MFDTTSTAVVIGVWFIVCWQVFLLIILLFGHFSPSRTLVVSGGSHFIFYRMSFLPVNTNIINIRPVGY